jgi:chemotaxis protein methyltransferase CheR
MLQPNGTAELANDQTIPVLNDSDFERIASLVHSISGIVLPENKRPMVQSRLLRRLQALRMASLSEYVGFVSGQNGIEERTRLVSAVTTNVTAFFREEHHFDTLEKAILPALKQKVNDGARLRIWSAGCSSGEEPYSLAAVVKAVFPDAESLDIRILATDIDQVMIDHVRKGVYASDGLRGIGPERLKRLFGLSPAEISKRDMVEITSGLQRMIRCNPLNLQEEWPMRGKFDIIFCRNVVIYFDRQTQERLWQRFAAALNAGGYLMIGHSERITGPALSAFSAEGITTYRRL